MRLLHIFYESRTLEYCVVKHVIYSTKRILIFYISVEIQIWVEVFFVIQSVSCVIKFFYHPWFIASITKTFHASCIFEEYCYMRNSGCTIWLSPFFIKCWFTIVEPSIVFYLNLEGSFHSFAKVLHFYLLLYSVCKSFLLLLFKLPHKNVILTAVLTGC